MSVTEMPPPGDKRCQIYSPRVPGTEGDLERCRSDGTHWVKWSGCECIDEEDDDCMADFFSWECDTHDAPREAA
jgi:hypothetical protein